MTGCGGCRRWATRTATRRSTSSTPRLPMSRPSGPRCSSSTARRTPACRCRRGFGCGRTSAAMASRVGSSIFPTRTTGCSSRRTRESGTRRSWASSTSTCWGRNGSGRACCEPGTIAAMTELGIDSRAIERDAPQYNATLVRRDDQHDSLGYFWVRFDADPTPFASGQYMTIGVFADGKLVQRPYSIASDPAHAGWAGRTGRVEANVESVIDELVLTPSNTIAYICGNPDMIIAAEATLLARGFPEPQVKKELYWPKGKEPKAGPVPSDE